ncbi:fatty acid desaturase family protein [Acidihalobacter prosperus]
METKSASSWFEFRDPSGRVPTWAALAYCTVGYAVGVWLLTLSSIAANAVGVLLTAHALVIAAYFIHEFAHFSIFKNRGTNNWFGELMCWITGACYARFDDLRRKHLRHHADRADVITFDYRKFLRERPAWMRKLVFALEWLYIPAVELIMHGFVIALPFFSPYHKGLRTRVITVLAVRLALFGALAWYAPRAVLLYAVSYLLMLTALRFLDAFQHTYVAYPILANGQMPDIERRDKDYEYHNTYSNLISTTHPWLNLLSLNFVYHNAHHAKASVPWYRLPELHRELYGEQDPQVLPSWDLLRTFHRNRMARILDDDYGVVAEGVGPGRANAFVGAVGVSFLTAV